LTGNAGLASQFENPDQQVIFTRAELESVDGPSAYLGLSLWEGAGALTTGFQIGSFLLSGKETDLRSCGICLSISTDPLLGPTIPRSYFAFFGAVTIRDVQPKPGGTLSASILDLRLREVTYDEHGVQMDANTPCTIAVDGIEVEMSVQEP
jgi:hypothetical protein